MTSELVALLMMLVLSGFFSSAETALFSLSSLKVEHLARDGGRAIQLIRKMKSDPHALLTTILIGNNIVNLGMASLATAVAIRLKAPNAVSLATGAITLLILVFGEIVPKTLATTYNVTVSQLVIYPLYGLYWVLRPMVWLLGLLTRITGRPSSLPAVTEEELKTIIEVGEEAGEIRAEEKTLIQNIFKFDDICASEIMTSSADMFVVDCNEPFPMEAVAKSGFSRIPVIDGDIDHVAGILNLKDLFQRQAETHEPVGDIRPLLRKPYFVPESVKINTLLHQFKRRKDHVAIVVNEYGEVVGLVSLEDVLEELVGEIHDETDVVKPNIIRLQNREWMVQGKTSIHEVNEILDMTIDKSNDYDTFSGFVMGRIGRIPQEKEHFVFGRFIVTVKEMEGNRINTFLVRRK
ncbi:MAG: hypothetical protein CSA22_03725 [Deltaproteobacteria bacterium]|nr:MAG: hypothetical protein CSA22_03725 [Deltaproteobacteria bacterium]